MVSATGEHSALAMGTYISRKPISATTGAKHTPSTPRDALT